MRYTYPAYDAECIPLRKPRQSVGSSVREFSCSVAFGGIKSGGYRPKCLYAGQNGFGPIFMGSDFAHAAAVAEHGGAVFVQNDLCGFYVVRADAVVAFNQWHLVGVDGGFADQAMQQVFADFFGQEFRPIHVLEDGGSEMKAMRAHGGDEAGDNAA